MAVVKANAYGHGLVSHALALADADAFAVARLEEAVALRAAGLKRRIVLLEGVFNAEQLAEAAHLELDLVVHQDLQIALLVQDRQELRFRTVAEGRHRHEPAGLSSRTFPRCLGAPHAAAARAAGGPRAHAPVRRGTRRTAKALPSSWHDSSPWSRAFLSS